MPNKAFKGSFIFLHSFVTRFFIIPFRVRNLAAKNLSMLRYILKYNSFTNTGKYNYKIK